MGTFTQAQITRKLHRVLADAAFDGQALTAPEVVAVGDFGGDRYTASLVLQDVAKLGLVTKTGDTYFLAEFDADAFCTAHYELRCQAMVDKANPKPLPVSLETYRYGTQLADDLNRPGSRFHDRAKRWAALWREAQTAGNLSPDQIRRFSSVMTEARDKLRIDKQQLAALLEWTDELADQR